MEIIQFNESFCPIKAIIFSFTERAITVIWRQGRWTTESGSVWDVSGSPFTMQQFYCLTEELDSTIYESAQKFGGIKTSEYIIENICGQYPTRTFEDWQS